MIFFPDFVKALSFIFTYPPAAVCTGLLWEAAVLQWPWDVKRNATLKKKQQIEKYCKSKHYNRSWIKCKRSRKQQQQNLTKHNRNVSGLPITWWTSWGSDRNQKNVNDCNGAGLKQDHQGCEGFFLFPLIFIQVLLCFVCFCSSFLFASDFLSCSTFDLSWLP